MVRRICRWPIAADVTLFDIATSILPQPHAIANEGQDSSRDSTAPTTRAMRLTMMMQGANHLRAVLGSGISAWAIDAMTFRAPAGLCVHRDSQLTVEQGSALIRRRSRADPRGRRQGGTIPT